MPNWVKNRITITGGNPEDIIKRHIVTNEDGNQVFDFNTLIKMPEDLLLEKGYRSEDGIKLYIGKICPYIEAIGTPADKLTMKEFFAYMERLYGSEVQERPSKFIPGAMVVEPLVERYRKRGDLDDVVGLGERCIKNLETCGHTDWYEWSCANWGTKWNACSSYVDGNSIFFDTAWSPPLPILQKLSEMHPEHSFLYSFSEEQPSVMCGHMTYEKGRNTGMNFLEEESKEAYETYFELWGDSEGFQFDETKGTYVFIEDEEME